MTSAAEHRAWKCVIVLTMTSLAIRVAAVQVSGVPLPWLSAIPEIAALGLGSLLIGSYYCWVRGEDGLAAPLLGLGVLMLGSIAMGEATDLAFYYGRDQPLADETLSAADGAVGFCWQCYATWLDAHPAIYHLCDTAYRSILLQAPLTVIGLSLCRQRLRLCAFLIASNLSILLTSLIAFRIPALGPYTHYAITAAGHPHIAMMFSDDMRGTITWLREGTFTTIPDGLVTGLISFPSFHAAMAFAYVWAAWPTMFRWPILALNAAMIAVTPIDGSHYLMDVVIGFGVGMLCVATSAAALEICRRPIQEPSLASASLVGEPLVKPVIPKNRGSETAQSKS